MPEKKAKTKAKAPPRKPKRKPNGPTRTKESIAAAKGPANSYIYTEALADKLCARLARGEGLKPICKCLGIDSATVLAWSEDVKHPFAERYFLARKLAYLHLAEELLEISDDSTGDVTKDENGNAAVNHANIQRSRFMVDTMKWLLARLLPKVFGDRLTTEHTGPNGGPVQVDVQSQIDKFMAQIDAIARRKRELKALEVESEQEREQRR
jgi:hypothetical protein